ncbi:MAG: PilN domain-containing protein [Chromatiales bacterium]|nr:PilN domain-containing protein [Chromatiales bacterium]
MSSPPSSPALEARGQSAAHGRLGTFLAWWGEGLSRCVPERLRRNLRSRGPSLVAELVGEELIVRREGHGPSGEYGRLPWRGDDAAAGWSDRSVSIPASLRTADAVRVLRLPRERVLSKTVDYPAEAEPHLARSLVYQVERLTPFKAGQLYFGHRVAGRNHAAGRIEVEVFIAPRGELDPLLDGLARLWGREVTRIEVAGAGDEVDLLPQRAGTTRRGAGRLTRWLVVLLALSMLAALAVPLAMKRERVIALNHALHQVQGPAMQVQEARARLDEAQGALTFLAERRQRDPQPLAALAELSRVLPDSVFITRFDQRDDRITVQGEAERAAPVIDWVQSSPLFHQARFLASVTRDARSGRERFQLELRLVAPKEGE